MSIGDSGFCIQLKVLQLVILVSFGFNKLPPTMLSISTTFRFEMVILFKLNFLIDFFILFHFCLFMPTLVGFSAAPFLITDINNPKINSYEGDINTPLGDFYHLPVFYFEISILFTSCIATIIACCVTHLYLGNTMPRCASCLLNRTGFHGSTLQVAYNHKLFYKKV